jgi:hypothetical protein
LTYAPIEGKAEENDAFYKDLQKIIILVGQTCCCSWGDFNGRVGNIPVNSNVGRFGETI